MNAYANLDLRGDAEEARKPAIRFIFEFPELLQAFEEIDPGAQIARRQSRRLGFASIALVLAALLLASADPALEGFERDLREMLGYGAALLGLAGTLLGALTLGKGSPRTKWLLARLQTESLRLFHFHYLARRLPDALPASGDPQAQAAYCAERKEALDRMRQALLSDPVSTYARLLADREFAPFAGLIAPSDQDAIADPALAADALAAWRALRLEWQIGYCEAKLSERGRLGATPKRQERLFATIAWSCIAVIVGLHLAHFVEHALHLPQALLQTGVVWTALIALGARALESGLSPQREVERYEQYRSNIRVALRRFDEAASVQARLEVMRGFEATSQEEMLVFIRTHAHSHFLL